MELTTRPSVFISREEYGAYAPFGEEAMSLLKKATARWSIGGVRYSFGTVAERNAFVDAIFDVEWMSARIS